MVVSRIHVLEHIGIVRELQLLIIWNNPHELLVSWLILIQIVFVYCSADYSQSFVLAGHLDALVHIATVHLQAHLDDKGVTDLLVVEGWRGAVAADPEHRALVVACDGHGHGGDWEEGCAAGGQDDARRFWGQLGGELPELLLLAVQGLWDKAHHDLTPHQTCRSQLSGQ